MNLTDRNRLDRITVEQVLAAYKATGLKPLRGHSYIKDGGTCAIRALALAGGAKPDADPYDAVEAMGPDAFYVCGFWSGFDGHAPPYFGTDQAKESADQGYADGLAAAAAVFGGAQ